MKEFSEQYLSLLNGEYKDLNLTRINSSDEFYYKQVLDSVYPYTDIDFIKELYNKHDHIVDVGFGGGFPLLPLAYLMSDKTFNGFEARRKKSDAVFEISKKLGLTNVKTSHQRIETVHFNKKCIISLKAVGKIEDFLSKIFSSVEVNVVFYKGPRLHELENVPEKFLGFNKVFEESYPMKMTDGRSIIVYRGRNVPRGTQKNLVNFSTLI